MTNELREKTSDWILTEGYVFEDASDGSHKHNYLYSDVERCLCCTLCLTKKEHIHSPVKYDLDKQALICTNCKAVIIDTKQVEEIKDWFACLCSGRLG